MTRDHSFLDERQLLTRLPRKAAQRKEALAYVAALFEVGHAYTEPEVNEILKNAHTFNDWTTLRRELVSAGYLGRTASGSEYRKLKPSNS